MALDYVSFRLLAERLINENGRSFTLTRKDQGNPETLSKPWRSSTKVAEISFAVVGVFVEFEKDEVDGTLVKRGDKRLFIAAKDIDDQAPANTNIEDYDEITDGAIAYRIINAQVIEPGPTRIMYELQVRQ